MPKRVIFVDLYCGMGGATQGALDAGAEVVLSVDSWSVAKELHEYNYPDVPFVLHSLGDAYADYALIAGHLRRYRNEDVHIHIHGSPPCQALSAAKGRLYPEKVKESMRFVHEYLALIAILKGADLCDSWSMENVSPVKKYMPDSVPHQMIMASDFGAPQNRYRYFAGEGWVAIKTGGARPWNEVLSHLELPDDALLNMGGGGESACERNRLCDRPIGVVANTTTSQGPTIRVPNGEVFKKIHNLTLHEKALITGFPATIGFPDTVNITDCQQALGNCVCPQAMKAIILGIRQTLHWL